MKISSSSFRSSSSDLVFEVCSSVVCGGSHEATRRWLRARATFARLRIMSVEDILSFFLVFFFSFFFSFSFCYYGVGLGSQDGRETFDTGGNMVTAWGTDLGLAWLLYWELR